MKSQRNERTPKSDPQSEEPTAALIVTLDPDAQGPVNNAHFHVMIANCDALELGHALANGGGETSEDRTVSFRNISPGRYYVLVVEAGQEEKLMPAFVHIRENGRPYYHLVDTTKFRTSSKSKKRKGPSIGKITATVLVNNMRSAGKTIVITATTGPAYQRTTMTNSQGMAVIDELPNDEDYDFTAYCPPHSPITKSAHVLAETDGELKFEFPTSWMSLEGIP